MTLDEQILEELGHLSTEKKQQVLQRIEELRRVADGLEQRREFEMAEERRWIKENRERYLNLWVALDGSRLIAADSDALKVYAAAKAEGVQAPFVVHLVPEDKLPFVPGWC
jgi:hypothetical protein